MRLESREQFGERRNELAAPAHVLRKEAELVDRFDELPCIENTGEHATCQFWTSRKTGAAGRSDCTGYSGRRTLR